MSNAMKVSIIVATDDHGTIGNATGIPWHLPTDLKRFKKLTMGRPILMGRTTHEHIGRPLPGRTNIVLSRREGYTAERCLVATSLQEGLELARQTGAEEAFVIGGGESYREALPLAETIYLTRVTGTFPGSVRFPIEELGSDPWVLESEEQFEADALNPHATRFHVLKRH